MLCVGYLAEQIEDFVGDGSRFGLSVDYNYDGPKLLGTGGALRASLGELGKEFLVMYGDSWLDTSYGPVVDAFRASHRPALMTVFRNEGKWDTSNVWFEKGVIRCYDKRVRIPEMHYIDWGLGVLRAEVIAGKPADTVFDLADIYAELARGGDLTGYEVNTRFYEIGSPAGLRETDALLRGYTKS